MRDNNKGFTLIEILAAITILAIISTISVIAVTRYVEKTKEKSYETMVQSVCDAANNYIINEGLESEVVDAGSDGITYDALNLMEDKYLENLMDPNDKERRCGANVNVKLANGALDDDSISEFSYFVKLRCKNYSTDVGFSHGCVINKRVVDPGSPEPTVPDPIVNPNPGGGGGTDPDNPNPDPGVVDPDDSDIVTPGVDIGSTELSCSILKENTSWTNQAPVEVQVKCIPNGNNTCQHEVYTKTFYSDKMNDIVGIYDNAGNAKFCNVKVYIDTSAPSAPVVNNIYEDKWANTSYSISLKSNDTTSGIAYFAYRYPHSNVASEREWHKYANSSRIAGDDTAFITTNFSKERNEIVEFIACDKAGNCSDVSSSMIKIDKTAPTCTIYADTSTVGKTIVTGSCSDTGGSGCIKYNIQKTFNFNQIYDSYSPGTVYDNAGNATTCPEYSEKQFSVGGCALIVGHTTVSIKTLIAASKLDGYGIGRTTTPVFGTNGGKKYIDINGYGMYYGYVRSTDGNIYSCSAEVIDLSKTRYNRKNNYCNRTETGINCAKNASVSYTCDSGYTYQNGECMKVVPATETKYYNKSTYACYTFATNGTFHTCSKITDKNKCTSTSGCSWNGTSCSGTGGYCDPGFTKFDASCKKVSYNFASNSKKSLTSKCVPDDGVCSSSESRDKVTCSYSNSIYSCSLGKLSNNQCEITVAPKPSYSCASGYTLVGDKCYQYNVKYCSTGFSKVSSNYDYSFQESTDENVATCAVEGAFTCNESNYEKSYTTGCEEIYPPQCPDGYRDEGDGHCLYNS